MNSENIDLSKKTQKFFSNLKIISYNVNGLANKLLFSDFFNYIRTFDIFILIETHVENDKLYGKYFEGFEVEWRLATRRSRFGRTSGGCTYGVNKRLKKLGLHIKFDIREGLDLLVVKDTNCTFTLVPTYLRGENWNSEFHQVKNFFEEVEILNPIIMGDLNIRIGEHTQEIDEVANEVFRAGIEERKSKDKIANSKGETFLEFCNDFGLFILNGTTKGDEKGEFTYISTIGQSVNDFCAISTDMLQNVEEFKVDIKKWSDHLPIILSLKISLCGSANESKLLPKMRWVDNKKAEYQRNLNRYIIEKKNVSQELNVDDLRCIIRKAFGNHEFKNVNQHRKSKWFDNECEKARRRSFKHLNQFRDNDELVFKERYLEANKYYIQLCKQKKKKYYELLDRKLTSVEDSKEWWSVAREIRNQTVYPRVGIEASDFKSYFQQHLNHPQIARNIQYAKPLVIDEFLDSEITMEELRYILAKVKVNKAAGEDRIPYEFFINASGEFLSETVKVFNKIYAEGVVEECFSKSIIFPIYKKGNPDDAANYRGISFINCISKLFIGIINHRLTNWVESKNILNEYQAGFRKKYSTMDNIYNITSIANLKFHEKKKLYAFFIDFKAAFDKIPRKLLFYKLYKIGLSMKVMNVIESIYENTEVAIWTGEDISDYFETKSGVKQGCLMSPILFALYLNDLNDSIDGGVDVNGLNIKVLMYADDIVMIAENPEVLQNMINQLEVYCNLWNMELNLSKSEIMIFRRGGRLANNEKWSYRGETVRITSEYCYLGFILTPKLSFTKHIAKRTRSAKNSINSVWKNFLSRHNIPLKSKWKVYQAVSRAIQSYGAQVYGCSNLEEVDKLQRFFLKRLFKLPSYAPNYAVDLEFGTESGYIYTLNLHQNYIMKTLFEYNEERLPHKLSKLIVEKNIAWVKEWNNLGRNYNKQWNLSNLNLVNWSRQNHELLENLRCASKELARQKATSSVSRVYKYLDFSKGECYINKIEKTYDIAWIFKARVELLYLKGAIYVGSNSNKQCTICNLGEDESIQHFIGKCPVLREFRIEVFNKDMLSEEEIINILNGINDEDFKKMLLYLKTAMKYRNFLINEGHF